MDKDKAIEFLKRALDNCDHIGEVGPFMVDVVKGQIQAAIDGLEGK